MDGMAEAGRALLGLGLDAKDLGLGQMVLRAVTVYGATVVMVRLGKKRFMGQASAFDVILGIMLGSIVSRAVTGNAPLGPALAAAATLLAMHWLFSAIALRFHGFGWAVKGAARTLIRNGQPDETALRRAHMTEHDLAEDLRSHGRAGPAGIAEARLERSGRLSVIGTSKEPQVVEVQVAEGVQTVRIELAR